MLDRHADLLARPCFGRPPRRIFSPFSGLSPRDDALAVFRTLRADPLTTWPEVAAFLTLHPWCVGVWKEVGKRLHRRRWDRAGSPDDIVQSGQSELWESLARKTGLSAWLEQGERRFHGWVYRLVLNMCRHAARQMRREALGTDKLRAT